MEKFKKKKVGKMGDRCLSDGQAGDDYSYH